MKNPEFPTLQTRTADILLFGKKWHIPYEERQDENGTLPTNFGVVIPGLVYRGSWPKNIDQLLKIGIQGVVTLYSHRDIFEITELPILQQRVQAANLHHTIVDIQDTQDLWTAAKQTLASNAISYIHCQAGANRTSMASLIISFKHMQQRHELCDKKTLITLIGQSIHHGFDWDKENHRKILENVLTDSVSKKLIPPSILS